MVPKQNKFLFSHLSPPRLQLRNTWTAVRFEFEISTHHLKYLTIS